MSHWAQEIVMIAVHSFKSLQATFEARASEWMLTGAVISLGFIFFSNGTMFYQDTFSGIRDIINDQYAWGSIFLSVGLVRLTVLCINGAYWRTPHFRALTAFFSAGIWFVLCLSFLRNGSMLAAVLPWLFFLDAYNVKRASREAGKSEFIQRYMKSKKQEMDDAGRIQGSHA